MNDLISAASLARSLHVSRETVLALAAVVETSPHYTGQPGALTVHRLNLSEDWVWLTGPAATAIRHEIERSAYDAHADAEFARFVADTLDAEAERAAAVAAAERTPDVAVAMADLGPVNWHWRWPGTTETGCGVARVTNLFTTNPDEVSCRPCLRMLDETGH